MKVKFGKTLAPVSRNAKKVFLSGRFRALTDYPPNSPPLGSASVSYTTEAATINGLQFSSIRFIDSSNTLGTVVEGTSADFILWDPSKREAIRAQKEPKLRRYNPPKFNNKRPREPKLAPPVQSLGMDSERYQHLMTVYEDLVRAAEKQYVQRLNAWLVKRERWKLKVQNYDASYSRAVVRYKRRLNNYIRRLTSFGGPGYKRLTAPRRYQKGTEYSLFEVKVPVETSVTRRYSTNNLYVSLGSYTDFELSDDWQVPFAYETSSLISSLSGLSAKYDQKLKQQVISKLSNGSVDGGILLGESRETAEMLVRVYRFLRDLRTRPARTLRRMDLRTANSLYLGYHFGVSPLIDDLKRLTELFGYALRTNGQVKVKVGLTRSLDREFIPLYRGITVSGQVKVTRTYNYSVANPFYRVLEVFGLLNAPSVAWELVPLSFIFDWFYDVGGYLSAQTASSGLEPLEAWETLDVKGYGTMGGVFGESITPESVVSVGASLPSGTTDTYRRTVSFSSGAVRLKVRRRISNDLSVDLPHIKLGDWPISKLITSISLIYQRVPRLY